MAKQYLLCIMLDNKASKPGYKFEQWPLHITVMYYFTPGTAIRKLLPKFEKLSASIPKTSVVVGPKAMYGENKDIPVNVIEDKNQLQPIHDVINMLLQIMEIDSGNPDFVGASWSPHISWQNGKKKAQGDNVEIKNLVLISKDNNSKQKVVEKVFDFA